MPGHEFRQTQTALSAYYIQKNHDFSLAYPTPVLGRPWSIPLEFPLYQWTVVGLSNATGLELTKAGRLVSITCFYLTLPFIFLLLGRLGLTWPRRLLALGLVVCCPLYVFYARSFLIETMALMFSMVFLWSYLNLLEKHRAGWWALASLAGSAAGLVKVTTFLFILLPAFGWTCVWLWRERPRIAGTSWCKLVPTATWGLSAVVLPFAAVWWWEKFADQTKALNPAADFLVSDRLNGFIFGTSQTRFSPLIWQHHFTILFRDIVAWWAMAGAGIMALVFARRWWAWIALLVGFFFAVQLLLPELYAWHEYYYVANAFMLMLAMGLALCGVLDSRLPRVVAWGLVLAIFGGQIWRYATTDYPMQRGISGGGDALTRTLKAVTDPNDVLVIIGNDWSPEIPYYAQRRALMIRRGMEGDQAGVSRALQQLKGERIGALVLHGNQEKSRWLIDRLVQTYDLEPRPVYRAEDSIVYLHCRNWLNAMPTLAEIKPDNLFEITPEAADEHPLLHHEVNMELLLDDSAGIFSGMHPAPWKYYSDVGIDRCGVDGREWFGAHPVTRLWFKVPAGRRHFSVEIELLPEAYAETVPYGDRTDGIELAFLEEPAGGPVRPLFTRRLNPREIEADRGVQRVEYSEEFAVGTVVQIAVLPGPTNSYARDWALLGEIEIK